MDFTVTAKDEGYLARVGTNNYQGSVNEHDGIGIMKMRKVRGLVSMVTAIGAMTLGLVIGTSSLAGASTSLNLTGGNVLDSVASSCGTYWSACTWKTFAQTKGSNPTDATWITVNTVLTENGIGLSAMTISDPVSITFTVQNTLLWDGVESTNNYWYIASSGTQGLDWASLTFTVQSLASVYAPIYGVQRGLSDTATSYS